MSEVVDRLVPIVESAGAPVIADADTGYGNALCVHRTVRAFERIGVAALHLEDQTFPKRCGHLDDKAVVPLAEMVQKLRAARDAAADPEVVLIARTDALAVEGLDAAIDRAHAYAAAGADVVFVEAPESLAQIEAIAARLPYPKLINMFQGEDAARPRRAVARAGLSHRHHPVRPPARGDPRDGGGAGRHREGWPQRRARRPDGHRSGTARRSSAPAAYLDRDRRYATEAAATPGPPAE